MASSTPPLFLQDSGDERESVLKPNFFGDSDEEMELEPTSPAVLTERPVSDEEDVIEERISRQWRDASPAQPKSSSSNYNSPIEINDSDEEEQYRRPHSPPTREASPSPLKKRRVSPEASADTASSLPTGDLHDAVEPPSPTSLSTYLGEMIVADAWATCSGKGLLSAGERVTIHMELADEDKQSKKKAEKATASKGKSKQLTLTLMMKKDPPKAAGKAKGDNFIVRFSNEQGQGS